MSGGERVDIYRLIKGLSGGERREERREETSGRWRNILRCSVSPQSSHIAGTPVERPAGRSYHRVQHHNIIPHFIVYFIESLHYCRILLYIYIVYTLYNII